MPEVSLGLCGEQFGNADQIVGDQVEQEVGVHAGDPAMFDFSHCKRPRASKPPPIRDGKFNQLNFPIARGFQQTARRGAP